MVTETFPRVYRDSHQVSPMANTPMCLPLLADRSRGRPRTCPFPRACSRCGLLEVTDPEHVRVAPESPSARGAGLSFAFDRVWGADSTQGDVFTEIQPLLTSLFDGYNVRSMSCWEGHGPMRYPAPGSAAGAS